MHGASATAGSEGRRRRASPDVAPAADAARTGAPAAGQAGQDVAEHARGSSLNQQDQLFGHKTAPTSGANQETTIKGL